MCIRVCTYEYVSPMPCSQGRIFAEPIRVRLQAKASTQSHINVFTFPVFHHRRGAKDSGCVRACSDTLCGLLIGRLSRFLVSRLCAKTVANKQTHWAAAWTWASARSDPISGTRRMDLCWPLNICQSLSPSETCDHVMLIKHSAIF